MLASRPGAALSLLAVASPGGIVWNVDHELGRALLYAGFAFGWGSFLPPPSRSTTRLFGLRQSWRAFRGQPQEGCDSRLRSLPSRSPSALRRLAFTFWSTPTMTVTHLLFAAVTTSYILFAIQLEERDLMRAHPEYAAYRRRVPRLVPAWPRTERDAKSPDTVSV